jgi:autotransporter strand-loop-strand O-heptosyltransferase
MQAKVIDRKVKIELDNNSIFITNLTKNRLENCFLDVKNILYGIVCESKFDLEPEETITLSKTLDNFHDQWKDEKLYFKMYSNHKKILDRYYNDKSKCFVLLTNSKFESLVEQLIIGLDKYTDIDILHYTIGYKSELNYNNLKNIEFEINEDTNDSHYMQFAKAPVFLDVLNRGYKNAIFLDADIQVRPNIINLIKYLDEIEDGPILQKGAHNFTFVNGNYIPGPLVKEYLNLPEQKFPHGITNIVLFNHKHKNLFEEWEKICFSDEIKEIKKNEFLHDELLLNCLFWKLNIKPKYYFFATNVNSLEDVKFFYNFNNTNFNNKVDMNNYGQGHAFQSFFPYDKEEVMMFHCIKDIEVAKSINNYVLSTEVDSSFSKRMCDFYKNLKKTENRVVENNKIQILNHYIDGPYLEILADSNRNFVVIFYDGKRKIIHTSEITGNMWTKCNRKYYDDYTVEVIEEGVTIYKETINLEGKRVLITLESSSLGDSLAWIPYAEEFRKKHNCELVLSTFLNDLYQDNYPNIQFIKPGEVVHNLHALYRIGWYYDENLEIDYSRVPENFRMQPMQKTATDILGLEFKEVKPILTIPNVAKKKRVGIAIHSTTQAKYWNNPNGWQEVCDYLKSKGYEVVLYSKEGDGYMGNYQPNGITKFRGGSLTDVIEDLSTCELFIGIGSGLSWLSWSINIPTIIISGFSYDYTETMSNTWRVINKSVCSGCFNRHRLDPGDWQWCPDHKDTNRHYECTKSITSDMVIEKIKEIISL